MKHETGTLREARRMLPLISSIARETRDRTDAIRRLEARLEELSTHRDEPITEIRQAESDLFLQRREFEHVEKELARLGCRVDAERPLRIVCSLAGRPWSYEERLDETGYRQGRPVPKT